MDGVVIFTPDPLLTITVEERSAGSELHLHAGGQGIWQARMLIALGVPVTMCGVFSGESGRIALRLIEDEGVTVQPLLRQSAGGAYVHDRRGGERRVLVETAADPLQRHDLDQLYSITLREALRAGIAILSGPADDQVLPADAYRRLAADLRSGGCRVIVDLSGERLSAAIAGRPAVVKVSDEELLRDGRATGRDRESIVTAIRGMREEGAATIIVTRAESPLLMLHHDTLSEVEPPEMAVVDSAGAGDSLTAGVAAGLARGQGMQQAITLGAAAGALNVTRHGLGSGERDTIEELRRLVRVRPIDGPEVDAAAQRPQDAAPAAADAGRGGADPDPAETADRAGPPTASLRLSPGELAERVERR